MTPAVVRNAGTNAVGVHRESGDRAVRAARVPPAENLALAMKAARAVAGMVNERVAVGEAGSKARASRVDGSESR